MKEITTTHQVHSENPFDQETLYKVQVTTKFNEPETNIDRKELTNQLLTSMKIGKNPHTLVRREKDLNKSEKLYKAQQIRSLLRNISEGE